MPISVTERKKAEELIKAKFKNLTEALDNEVKNKRDELHEAWSHRIGLDKLKQQIAKKKAELEALEEQVEKMTEGRYYRDDYEACVPKARGKLRVALNRLEAAHREAQSRLDEKKSETLEHLWFGLLSADALKLLAGIPTMTQLKSNGMSLLQLPAAKLLGSGK